MEVSQLVSPNQRATPSKHQYSTEFNTIHDKLLWARNEFIFIMLVNQAAKELK